MFFLAIYCLHYNSITVNELNESRVVVEVYFMKTRHPQWQTQGFRGYVRKMRLNQQSEPPHFHA